MWLDLGRSRSAHGCVHVVHAAGGVLTHSGCVRMTDPRVRFHHVKEIVSAEDDLIMAHGMIAVAMQKVRNILEVHPDNARLRKMLSHLEAALAEVQASTRSAHTIVVMRNRKA